MDTNGRVEDPPEDLENGTSLRTVSPVWKIPHAIETITPCDDDANTKNENVWSETKTKNAWSADGTDQQNVFNALPLEATKEDAPNIYTEQSYNKRNKSQKNEQEELMDMLQEKMSGITMDNKAFVKHKLVQFENPTITALLVTADYVVVSNQTKGILQVRWFASSSQGGLTVCNVVNLENSHGFPLNNLPKFSYTATTLAACDAMGRISMWCPESGQLKREINCTTSTAEFEDILVTEPSLFCISTHYIIVARADTESFSTFFVLAWKDEPFLGKYGKAETTWDEFKCCVGLPTFAAVYNNNPFE